MMTRLNEAAQQTAEEAKPFGDGAESRCCDETSRRKEEKPFGDGAESRCCDETPGRHSRRRKKRSRLETARRADAAMTRLNEAAQKTEKEAKPFGDGAESRCCDDTLE